MKINLREVVIAFLTLVVIFAAFVQVSIGSYKAEGVMAVFWWFVGAVLIGLSFVVWRAGMQGKAAILSIGKRTAAKSKVAKSKTAVRPANIFNVVIGMVGILVGLTLILLLAF
jgi:hypothetical protein